MNINKKWIIIFTIIIIILSIIVMFGGSFLNVDKETFKDTKGANDDSPTFNKDIKQLFRPIDIDAMKWKFDLSNYDDVKKYSQDILRVVETGDMPCDAPWSKGKIGLFKFWIKSGMLE